MDAQKLGKVLAMAASDNDAEALHALRTAKRLLDGYGADFVELARRVAEPSGPKSDALEDAMFDLRNEIRHLRAENERMKQAAATPIKADSFGFHDAARDAAAGIRLRADLDRMTEELAASHGELARLRSHEATMHEQFREALAEAGKLGVRLSDAESRRMCLEAENRRLSYANHALKVELDEVQARQNQAAAQMAIHDAHEEVAAKRPRKARAKLKVASGQYPLF